MKYLGNTAWDAGISLQELNHFLTNLILKKELIHLRLANFKSF